MHLYYYSSLLLGMIKWIRYNQVQKDHYSLTKWTDCNDFFMALNLSLLNKFSSTECRRSALLHLPPFWNLWIHEYKILMNSLQVNREVKFKIQVNINWGSECVLFLKKHSRNFYSACMESYPYSWLAWTSIGKLPNQQSWKWEISQ